MTQLRWRGLRKRVSTGDTVAMNNQALKARPPAGRVRLGIFGIGLHFQETYATAFKREAVHSLAEVRWVTDLTNKKELALGRCAKAGQHPQFIGVGSFKDTKLPDSIRAKLDRALADNPVDAVIVSTTPEQHRAYAEWAIAKGLDVLIDKPVTTRVQAAWDETAAMGILDDWQALNGAATNNGRLVMVNSHRRFHPAYRKITELLEEIADRTGVGVTSLSCFNSDGQWRLPRELLDIGYHGYDTGNGVVSHFGYHYLDLAVRWYRAGTPQPRRADRMEVISSFSTAANYAGQVSTADAARLLEQAGQPVPHNDDAATRRALASFGEVDAYCSVDMMRGDHLSGHINLQMLHSGFSQRAWTKPAVNLYKENGRVRWENHLIQQGSFQALEVRSFQAVQPNWKSPEEGMPRWDLGGADHLEINVYRNSLLGGPPLMTIDCKQLLDEIPPDDVIHEDVKAKTILLFISAVAVARKLPAEKLMPTVERKRVGALLKDADQELSLIGSHQPTTALMAAIYASHARRQSQPRANPMVSAPVNW